MSKSIDALHKLGTLIKVEPWRATKNTGVIITQCADEIDRLRGELDSVRVHIARALPFLRQGCNDAAAASYLESELV